MGVLDGNSYPLFVFGLTQCLIEDLLQSPPTGVLVVALDQYYGYHDSAAFQNTLALHSMGQKRVSKLHAYIENLHKPLKVLQQSANSTSTW